MSFFKSLTSFIRKNKKETLVILGIFFLGLVLRLWRIGEYLTFLGDEGRDVRIVRDLLHGNLVFIGPMTSIGNMYLGPLYYYMMAPALWLSGLNPVGPAIMIALLSSLTIVFTWWVGRTLFNPLTGLIAALLFSLSPVSIIYSHSSWNPNPMPFFALLCFWGIWQVWERHRFVWLIVVGASLAFALQMHYLGLLLIPTLGVFWILTAKSTWQDKNSKKLFLKYTLFALFAFLILMSPLALFDLKHNGQNANSFKAFFSDRQTTVNANPLRSDRFFPVISKIIQDLLTSTTGLLTTLTVCLISLLSFFFVFSKGKHQKNFAFLATFFFIGWLGLSVYKQHVYAHYFGFIFPVIYLLTGFLLSQLLTFNRFFKALGIVFLATLIYMSITHSPLRQTPNRQLARTLDAVNLIIKESKGNEFNFGLIAKQNYDESYRYFLENLKAPHVRGENKISDQLFVICEDGDKCQPEGNPAYQIAIFGPAIVSDTWNIDHLKIYRLTHSP